MAKFMVVHTYKTKKRFLVEAENEDAASDIVNGSNAPEPFHVSEEEFNDEDVSRLTATEWLALKKG